MRFDYVGVICQSAMLKWVSYFARDSVLNFSIHTIFNFHTQMKRPTRNFMGEATDYCTQYKNQQELFELVQGTTALSSSRRTGILNTQHGSWYKLGSARRSPNADFTSQNHVQFMWEWRKHNKRHNYKFYQLQEHIRIRFFDLQLHDLGQDQVTSNIQFLTQRLGESMPGGCCEEQEHPQTAGRARICRWHPRIMASLPSTKLRNP